ncbi:bifunctional acetate--CoA ligase family protein/GNAT family N-acetyltransferase [Massilia pseudoviolaceinigra]|uniref:bifunctional acetate--CoA ligase family protein/GNAT family N-acetyltransferase n=1 Tax=Massilia pseudoviolaceinigra TaxID=3057165 RepID=UPI0027969779|nr:bifunctional acetate--CoA ligase family protein/GNAT family N-acetyltransferase [Massilia sp. CCM 9206]MDQ1924002.1 bifunctional acetate--CoA ligase family protein/GNAT family N-acetyltransferase [Massilia sp. CCM 9206]
MSVRNLQHLFAPRSVAIIGASARPNSVGATVLRNVIEGGFSGAVYPVNPKYDTLSGLPVYARVSALPAAPDLAIICTPPATVPGLVRQLGEAGTRAAIILTAGLSALHDSQGRTLRQAALDAARPYTLRLLGPNCVGLLVPGIGLNASFAHTGALPGKIAFVSQSGALVTGVLDWAKSRGIGFSKFISLGDSADIDFGDLLDYLASDPHTSAILLYMEDVRHARKFMSAARAAARSKPTLVLKAGRVAEGAKAAASHTGALAGSDDVYDAAIRRAGMLRVLGTEDLFAAVATLAHARPLFGERLVILTNGGGPGVMATDAVVSGKGSMAQLAPDTVARLDAVLPSTWSGANPVDIIGDAPVQRYVDALNIVLQDPQADAILFIHAPTAIVPSLEIARAIAPLAKASSRNILACWLGGDAVAEARAIFTEAGIPSFGTPEEAVSAYLQIVQYRRNQNLLMQVPPAACDDALADGAANPAAARALVHAALASGRTLLSEPETKAVLAAYGVAVVQTRSTASVEEAVAAAREIGFPVALKILSPDITHKSDMGGVALDLEDADAVRAVAQRMNKRLAELQPQARLEGFSVQQMARRPEAHELIIGVATDPVFGPVILFGQGGIAVEVTADHAVALPPLNVVLARDLISRTRVARLLAGYRNRPPANMDAIIATLMRVSHMVADLPELVELDINPLLVDSDGALALDARMRVAIADQSASTLDRLAIRPYPHELEERIDWHGASLLLRPIQPEDGPAHVTFFNALSDDDVRYRMFVRVRELNASQLARFTQIDYDREMAFIATRPGPDGVNETLGVARVVCDPDNVAAEFAVTVRSDLKGQGLGQVLMEKLIAYCRSRGTREIVGEALPQNTRITKLARKLGFEISKAAEDGSVHMRLPL